jgi:hypothetical protein
MFLPFHIIGGVAELGADKTAELAIAITHDYIEIHQTYAIDEATAPSAPPPSPPIACAKCLTSPLPVAGVDEQLDALISRPCSPPLPVTRTIPLQYLPVVTEEEEADMRPPAYTESEIVVAANIDDVKVARSSGPENEPIISRESWYWLFYLISCGLWAGRHIVWAHLTGRPVAPRRQLSSWKTSLVIYLWKTAFVFVVQIVFKILLLGPIIWVGQLVGLVTVTRDGKLRGPRCIVWAYL